MEHIKGWISIRPHLSSSRVFNFFPARTAKPAEVFDGKVLVPGRKKIYSLLIFMKIKFSQSFILSFPAREKFAQSSCYPDCTWNIYWQSVWKFYFAHCPHFRTHIFWSLLPWILILFDQILNWIFAGNPWNNLKTTKFLFIKIGLSFCDFNDFSHKGWGDNRVVWRVVEIITHSMNKS